MRSIFSELVRQERLSCIDGFKLDEPKTKKAMEFLSSLDMNEVLIITDEVTNEMYLATRNIPRVDVIETSEIDPYSLIGFKNTLITKPALEKIEAWLA